MSDLSTWRTSVTAQPEYTSFIAALSSAAGSEFSNLVDADTAEATDTAVPTWWTKLDTEAQAYATSVVGDQKSIYSSDLAGAAAAPTPAPVMKAAGAAAAGVFAGAALLL